MKKFTVFFAILVFSVASFAFQTKYKIYSNARFNYQIAYPTDLLRAQGEAPNGDGQVFTNTKDDTEMRVFGSNMLLNETLQKEYNAVVAEHGAGVTYKTYKKNFFVVSALTDGKIFYQKTMAKNGAFVTFTIEYDEARRATYDQVVEQIVKSFK